MKFYAGLDPGISGALCLVDDHGKFVDAHVMPTMADRVSPKKLFDLIEAVAKDRDVIFYLEKPIPMRKKGSVGSISQGQNFGYCEMALAGLGISYELVAATVWSKEMHQGIDSKIKNPKIKSALKVQGLMGLDRFMVGKTVRRPHDGMVDAYLIALYAWRKNGRGKLSA